MKRAVVEGGNSKSHLSCRGLSVSHFPSTVFLLSLLRKLGINLGAAGSATHVHPYTETEHCFLSPSENVHVGDLWPAEATPEFGPPSCAPGGGLKVSLQHVYLIIILKRNPHPLG